MAYVLNRQHTSCFFPYTLDPPDMAVPGRVACDGGMSAAGAAREVRVTRQNWSDLRCSTALYAKR